MKLNLDNKWVVVALNLCLMALVGAGIGWLVLLWLNVWTGHGNALAVPDVKGLSEEQAETRLRSEGFNMEVADSIYDVRHRPGEIVDQNPRQNTQVKPGRLVYVTINAKSPKMVTVPRLTDMSSRQARAILEGLGIYRISEEPVISEFKDLVMGARADGKPLVAGARIPVTSSVVLEVGNGLLEAPDSLGSSEPADFERLDLF